MKNKRPDRIKILENDVVGSHSREDSMRMEC